MKRRESNPIPWSIAVAMMLSAAPAHAQEAAASAEALYRDANQLAEQGRYAEACPKFAASQKLDPGFGTAFNLGRCLERVGKTASAWAAFQEAAGLAKTNGQADREAKANHAAAALEGRLERMTVVVRTAPPGLVVRRSGVTVDPAAFGTALPVDPGKHVIEATAPGKRPFSTEITTKGPGQVVAVEIPVLEDGPRQGPTDTQGGVADYWSGRRVSGVVLGSAGIVGVIVGGVVGGVALSKNSSSKANCSPTDPNFCNDTGVALRQDAFSFGNGSTAALVVGGALLTTGIVLFATAPAEKRSDGARIEVVPGAGAFALRGRF